MQKPNLHSMVCNILAQELRRGPASRELELFMERYGRTFPLRCLVPYTSFFSEFYVLLFTASFSSVHTNNAPHTCCRSYANIRTRSNHGGLNDPEATYVNQTLCTGMALRRCQALHNLFPSAIVRRKESVVEAEAARLQGCDSTFKGATNLLTLIRSGCTVRGHFHISQEALCSTMSD
jgi:hypothetical protein